MIGNRYRYSGIFGSFLHDDMAATLMNLLESMLGKDFTGGTT